MTKTHLQGTSSTVGVDQESIARFKALLQARQLELCHSLSRVHQEGLTAEPDRDKDDGDRATSSQTRELLFRQTYRDRSLLAAIEGALARVDAGTFGECLSCGQDVNAKRLEAIPWVRYCITCQELIDGG